MNDDAPIELLAIDPGKRAHLQNAGIMTIAQLEAALQDEAKLKRDVSGCGDGAIKLYRSALADYRKRAGSKDVAEASKNSRGGRALLYVLAGVLVIALAEYFLFRRAFGLMGWCVINAILALVATVILINQFPGTQASIEASAAGVVPEGKWKVVAKIGGALVSWLIVFACLTGPLYFLASRTIQVYLVPKAGEKESRPVRAEKFEIEYRRAVNPGSARGTGSSLTIQDLPSWMEELVVIDFHCPGYILAKDRDGEPYPWIYPISGNEVTIEVVRKAPKPAEPPTADQVKALLKKKGYKESDVRRAGVYPRHQVYLTIDNRAEREIAFVVYDCAAAFEDDKAPINGPTIWKDYRWIQPNKPKGFGTFSDFDYASGWFAVIVRYTDRLRNEEKQEFVDIVNLFNTKRPVVVIQHDDEGFLLNRELSRLED